MKHSNLVLAVDLDGTLLHPEPGTIAVWGRTRHQYMSHRSAQLLAQISQVLPIVIATARHALTVKSLVDQLPDVNFCGFVLENGAVVKRSLTEPGSEPWDWSAIVAQLPGWERLQGYEQCLGLIPPAEEADRAQKRLFEVMSELENPGHLYVDGRKLFIYPKPVDKSMGIKSLGFHDFWAAGNDLNDVEMLRDSIYSVTLNDAHTNVQELVRSIGGYCANCVSHEGSENWLSHLTLRSLGNHKERTEDIYDFLSSLQ